MSPTQTQMWIQVFKNVSPLTGALRSQRWCQGTQRARWAPETEAQGASDSTGTQPCKISQVDLRDKRPSENVSRGLHSPSAPQSGLWIFPTGEYPPGCLISLANIPDSSRVLRPTPEQQDQRSFWRQERGRISAWGIPGSNHCQVTTLRSRGTR